MTEFWSICTSFKIYGSFFVRELVKWFTFCRTAGLKCTKCSIIKPDKTVNLKVHCRITNVIIMAYVEWSGVFLENSFDDSRGPHFHSRCLRWITVCCPEHRIFTTPPLCENLLLCASYIRWFLNGSNTYLPRTKIYKRCWVKLRATVLIFLLHSLSLVNEIISGCRAQLNPLACLLLLNIKCQLGAVSCLPYNF